MNTREFLFYDTRYENFGQIDSSGVLQYNDFNLTYEHNINPGDYELFNEQLDVTIWHELCIFIVIHFSCYGKNQVMHLTMHMNMDIL